MNIDDIPADVRAEMDGQAATPKTFTSWVNEMSAEEQGRIFGEREARRWRDGKITQSEILEQRRRPLAPEELE